jgi:hypothetical protein
VSTTMEIKNDGGLLELMRVGDGGLLEAIVWGTVPRQPPQKKYRLWSHFDLQQVQPQASYGDGGWCI